MRMFLTAVLLFLLGLTRPVGATVSALPEDLEGSGHDQEDSGSGSGDWSEKVSHDGTKNINGHSNSRDGRRFTVKAEDGSKDDSHGFPDRTFDGAQWAAKGTVVAKSKTFLENKEILAGIIAGGVTGLTLAIVLAGILIYKWQKKDDGGYILGQQRASDEDCHRPHRDEIVVI